jgi:hypothetical protein
MAELRAGGLWLMSGLIGMASLFVVLLFGLAMGLLALVVVSAPLLAGTPLRSYLLSLSGLLCGFGGLWLMESAGQLAAGVGPGMAPGGYPGLFAIGTGVVVAGSSLAVWRFKTRAT